MVLAAEVVTAPMVNKVVPPPTGLRILKVVAPESVTAPKVRPAVPLVTFAPPCTVNVCAPIARVPKVWVIPAEAAVALSE